MDQWATNSRLKKLYVTEYQYLLDEENWFWRALCANSWSSSLRRMREGKFDLSMLAAINSNFPSLILLRELLQLFAHKALHNQFSSSRRYWYSVRCWFTYSFFKRLFVAHWSIYSCKVRAEWVQRNTVEIIPYIRLFQNTVFLWTHSALTLHE